MGGREFSKSHSGKVQIWPDYYQKIYFHYYYDRVVDGFLIWKKKFEVVKKNFKSLTC